MGINQVDKLKQKLSKRGLPLRINPLGNGNKYFVASTSNYQYTKYIKTSAQ